MKLAMGRVTEAADVMTGWLHGIFLIACCVKGPIANENAMTIHPKSARLLCKELIGTFLNFQESKDYPYNCLILKTNSMEPKGPRAASSNLAS
jgi:hypothetical protein